MIGPHGTHSQGKLSPDDKGDATLAVTRWQGLVRIDFGVPMVWLAFDREAALALAELIQRAAAELPEVKE